MLVPWQHMKTCVHRLRCLRRLRGSPGCAHERQCCACVAVSGPRCVPCAKSLVHALRVAEGGQHPPCVRCVVEVLRLHNKSCTAACWVALKGPDTGVLNKLRQAPSACLLRTCTILLCMLRRQARWGLDTEGRIRSIMHPCTGAQNAMAGSAAQLPACTVGELERVRSTNAAGCSSIALWMMVWTRRTARPRKDCDVIVKHCVILCMPMCMHACMCFAGGHRHAAGSRA